MKLTVNLRMLWSNIRNIPTGMDGVYAHVWIDANTELIENRGYGHYEPDEEEIAGEQWETLKSYYWLYGLGELPPNAHPATQCYGLPNRVELVDYEWDEEDDYE